MRLERGDGWDIELVPAVVVTLACKHRGEIPAAWVLSDGRLSCGVQCPTCRRVTYDIELGGWVSE